MDAAQCSRHSVVLVSTGAFVLVVLVVVEAPVVLVRLGVGVVAVVTCVGTVVVAIVIISVVVTVVSVLAILVLVTIVVGAVVVSITSSYRTRRRRKFEKWHTSGGGGLLRLIDGRANPLMD